MNENRLRLKKIPKKVKVFIHSLCWNNYRVNILQFGVFSLYRNSGNIKYFSFINLTIKRKKRSAGDPCFGRG